ncbi:MAG TPA: hypothetical protein PKZ76_13375 [Xanthomonadaceae bacterium]|nr:hypothetical protein [Xanthomonadaceae bacterium]
MIPRMSFLLSLACVLIALPTRSDAGSPPVRAERLLSVGDALSGSTVQSLNVVYTNGEGRPGSIVALADGNRVIWYDGGAIFNSGDVASSTLTGGEATIGIGDQGRFIYSPNTDGQDSVWTHNGLLMRGTDPAPGFVDTFTTFHSRPSMLPDGTAVWVAGITDTKGGATQGRVLYASSTDGTPAPQRLLASGDMVGGFAITSTGIGFQYKASDNGQFVVGVLILDTGSTANNDAVHINGALVARESFPIGASAPGENWQGFAGVSINNAGHWILAGDTDGDTATDAFVAYNGEIGMREGGTYDGELLGAGSAVRALSINNLDQAVISWNTPGNVRKLFFADQAADLASARLLLKTGSTIDFNGDGAADATLIDILGTFTTTNALQFAENGELYLNVSYDEGGQTRTSLIRIAASARIFADGFEALPAP